MCGNWKKSGNFIRAIEMITKGEPRNIQYQKKFQSQMGLIIEIT